MRLELISRPWLADQPLAVEFGCVQKNGKLKESAVRDFLSALLALGLVPVVDAVGRPFVDTENAVWLSLSAKAEKRLDRGSAKPLETPVCDTASCRKPAAYGLSKRSRARGVPALCGAHYRRARRKALKA